MQATFPAEPALINKCAGVYGRITDYGPAHPSHSATIRSKVMRSDLYFKVEVEHDGNEDLQSIASQIARQILKIYGVRDAELSNFTSDE